MIIRPVFVTDMRSIAAAEIEKTSVLCRELHPLVQM